MWDIWTTFLSPSRNLQRYPRKCNSASSFSGCVQREKSKCCIALPTDAEHVGLFKKKLIGGFWHRDITRQ